MFITLTDFRDKPILININKILLIEPRSKEGSNILLGETLSVPVKEELATIQKAIIKGNWGVNP